jgi:hypothetical protein
MIEVEALHFFQGLGWGSKEAIENLDHSKLKAPPLYY